MTKRIKTLHTYERPALCWISLQQPKPAKDARPFIAMIIFIFMAFCLPFLAWADKNTVEIPVVERAVSAGSIISAADISTRTLEKRFLHPRMVRDPDELLNKEAIRNLRADHPVYTSSIRIPPEVRKNTVIEVEYVAPALTLRGTGKVLEDGSIGDTIRILNPESGKVMAGVVQANGEVIVR